MNAEQTRLEQTRTQQAPWKKWGPYLSERQWGTVREDYSEGGDAWNYFIHDQSRSRAYRSGEDGLVGPRDDAHRGVQKYRPRATPRGGEEGAFVREWTAPKPPNRRLQNEGSYEMKAITKEPQKGVSARIEDVSEPDAHYSSIVCCP
jgi:hypothetical protein